jgi:hypothetical protein
MPAYPQPGRSLDPRRKSPVLACMLSVMPGLGQIYVGYYRLGFIHALIVASSITFLANDVMDPLIPLVSIFLAFFMLYNVVDAGRRAAYYNYAVEGLGGVQIPEEVSMPAMGGSIAGGIILVVLGFVLLSNTLMDIPLDWLEQWWPVALVGFGLYLLARGWKERSAKGS